MKTALALLAALVAVGTVAVVSGASDPPDPVQAELMLARETIRGQQLRIRRLERANRAHYVAFRAQQRGRRYWQAATRRSWQPRIAQVISVAATAYGQNASTLLRKADCESGLYPFARNSGSNASGLFQFLPSTWNSTPFGRHSIWDPLAQALAASWMHSHGRSGEWVCQ